MGDLFSPIIGYRTDKFQIAGWNTLLQNLTDGDLDNLGGTGGGFGPGDVTAGFKWSVTNAAGGDVDFMTSFRGMRPSRIWRPAPFPNPALRC